MLCLEPFATFCVCVLPQPENKLPTERCRLTLTYDLHKSEQISNLSEKALAQFFYFFIIRLLLILEWSLLLKLQFLLFHHSHHMYTRLLVEFSGVLISLQANRKFTAQQTVFNLLMSTAAFCSTHTFKQPELHKCICF